MSTPRNIHSWQQVESRRDFVAHLRFLAVDCEQACDGRASDEPPAGRWVNRTVDGFLWGWVQLLGSGAEGSGPLGEEAPGRPGWRGLALQLDGVRTTPPAPDPALAAPGMEWQDVDSALDLRRYAATLAVDFARDRREQQARVSRGEWAGDGGDWAHGTLYDWLDAWAAWLGADSPLHARLEPVSWRSVALQLSAAKVYE